MTKFAAWMVAILILGMATPAAAEQTLYKRTAEDWFIYRETLSCTMYADFGNRMIRFSDRTDEGRLYFSIVDEAWSELEPRIGESDWFLITFPTINHGVRGRALTMRNPDGRMGYSSANLNREELVNFLSTTDRMEVRVGSVTSEPIARLITTGAAVAIMHLQACSARHFPR